ncbi:hypothetical protein GGS20DRAFT_162042 [Poronia punctata]|nr:hypothetical protein GGS20DRAFT_162042 [Poronia punctata]
MVLSMRVGATALAPLLFLLSAVKGQGFYYQDINRQCSPDYNYEYLGCAPATRSPFTFQPTQWDPNQAADNTNSYINYDLGGNAINVTTTPYFCANTCRAHGFKYSSFFDKSCSCGSSLSYRDTNNVVNTLVPNPDSDDLCTKGSSGNIYPKCGGDLRENCGSNQGARIFVDPSFPDERTLKRTPTELQALADGYGLLGCFLGARFASSRNEITTTIQADGPSCLRYCADLGLPFAFMSKNPLALTVTCRCGSDFGKNTFLTTTDIGTCSSRCSDTVALSNSPCSGQDCCNTGGFEFPVYANPRLMGCFNPVIPGKADPAAATPAFGTFSCFPTPSSIALRSASSVVSYVSKTMSASASFVATARPATNAFVNYGCYQGTALSTVLSDNVDAGLASVSVDACISACDTQGKTYAALVGDPTPRCYCGNNIGANLAIRDMELCNQPCPGSARQNCGGTNGPLVYARAGTANNQWASSYSATRSSTPLYTCTGPTVGPNVYAPIRTTSTSTTSTSTTTTSTPTTTSTTTSTTTTSTPTTTTTTSTTSTPTTSSSTTTSSPTTSSSTTTSGSTTTSSPTTSSSTTSNTSSTTRSTSTTSSTTTSGTNTSTTPTTSSTTSNGSSSTTSSPTGMTSSTSVTNSSTMSSSSTSSATTSPSGTAPPVPGITNLPNDITVILQVQQRNSGTKKRANWNMRRQAGIGGFVGGAGPATPETCDGATPFTLEAGMLEAGGEAVATDPDIAFIPFRVQPAGSISTTFTIINGLLHWYNPAFTGGEAGFCMVMDTEQVFITFQGAGSGPAGCVAVDIVVYYASQCVNGVIVAPGTGTGTGTGTGMTSATAMTSGSGSGSSSTNQAAAAIPTQDFIYEEGKAPDNYPCYETTESWVPGEPTFLPSRDEL